MEIKFEEYLKLNVERASVGSGAIAEITRKAALRRIIIPDDFDWYPLSTSAGKITTRLGKLTATGNKRRLSDVLDVAELGNIIDENYIWPGSYVIRFHRGIDWKNGEFGDERSCFWASKSDAKKVLNESGCFSVQFYSKEGTGIGRALAFQPNPQSLIVFNCYGRIFKDEGGDTGRQDSKLGRIAALLTHTVFPDLSYKKIQLTDHDQAEGLVFINNATGYLIAPKEFLDFAKEYDLNTRIDDLPHCFLCNKLTNSLYDAEIDKEEVKVCSDCYQRRFRKCFVCNKVHSREMSIQTSYDGQSLYFCSKTCMSWSGFRECSNCGRNNHVTNDRMWFADGKLYCRHCFQEHFSQCVRCHKTIPAKSSWVIDFGDKLFVGLSNALKLRHCKECYTTLKNEAMKPSK